MTDLSEYTRETLMVLWRTYCRAGLDNEGNDEMRRFVVDGLASVQARLDALDGAQIDGSLAQEANQARAALNEAMRKAQATQFDGDPRG